MQPLILTTREGVRVGVIISDWAADAAGGCIVHTSGGFAFEVVETFDEIGNALSALHVLEQQILKGRQEQVAANLQKAEDDKWTPASLLGRRVICNGNMQPYGLPPNPIGFVVTDDGGERIDVLFRHYGNITLTVLRKTVMPLNEEAAEL